MASLQSNILDRLYSVSANLQCLLSILSPTSQSVKSELLRDLFAAISPRLEEINGEIMFVLGDMNNQQTDKGNEANRSQRAVAAKILMFRPSSTQSILKKGEPL